MKPFVSCLTLGLVLLFTPLPSFADCTPFLVAKRKLELIVEDQLRSRGIAPADHAPWARQNQKKAIRLVQELSTLSWANREARGQWIERLIDLKISENLDPLTDFELSLNPRERKTLTRLILRRVIEQGLIYAEREESSPQWFSRLRQSLRNLRHHPIFRLSFEMQLPQLPLNLTDDQILSVLTEGQQALSKDPVLRAWIRQASQEQSDKRIQMIMMVVMSLGLVAESAPEMVDEINQAYELGHQQAVQENTNRFKENVASAMGVNASAVYLDMALTEIRLIHESFQRKFNGPPTSAESATIRQRVCEVRFATLLDAAGKQQCMQSPLL